MTVIAIASILAVTAMGLTIWGVKNHLSSKDDPSKKDNKDDNEKNNENIKVPNNEDSLKKDEKINNDKIKNKKSLISSENSAEKNKMENLSKDLKFTISEIRDGEKLEEYLCSPSSRCSSKDNRHKLIFR